MFILLVLVEPWQVSNNRKTYIISGHYLWIQWIDIINPFIFNNLLLSLFLYNLKVLYLNFVSSSPIIFFWYIIKG